MYFLIDIYRYVYVILRSIRNPLFYTKKKRIKKNKRRKKRNSVVFSSIITLWNAVSPLFRMPPENENRLNLTNECLIINSFPFFIDSGKKEQIEAVNLELVSMRPYTGNNVQIKGQEACEVPADPYEEYFVPVNEHRKYIR